MNFNNAYLIGIGGAGMSGLAKLMNDLNITISGSDREMTSIMNELQVLGINVYQGHDSSRITSDIDCVVYTLAISDENPELLKAKELGIPLFTYAEMLGEFSKNNYTIAVSGTHGKTTTTGMLVEIFKNNDKNPYAIVGSVLNKYKSNYLKGNENTFIVEACEYKKSFLSLSPNILVITNIDLDHLDYYKNIDEIKKAFADLISKMPNDGIIITDLSSLNILDILKNENRKVVNYNDFKKQVPDNIWGEHNISNAAVGLAISSIMNFDTELSINSLKEFSGTKRRLQCKGRSKNGALIYDDYAHHPTAIKATIKTLNDRFKDKKIILIFQPHTYSRTKGLFNEFVESLIDVDEIIILPIYSAREVDDGETSSKMLAKDISKNQKVIYFENQEDVLLYLKQKDTSEYLIITMGAGDVYKISDQLI